MDGLQESITKAKEYIGRLGKMDSTILILDANGDELALYSDRSLSGYKPTDGIYAKRMAWSGLAQEKKNTIKKLVSQGPNNSRYRVFAESKNSIAEYILDLYDEIRLSPPRYCLIPTRKAIEKILGADDRYHEYMQRRIASWTFEFPIDSIIVHEGVHGSVGHRLRADLKRELEERGFLGKDDHEIANELLSKIAHVCYLRENYPEFVEKAEEVFSKEAKEYIAYERFVREIWGIEVDTKDANKHPHERASQIYFQIKQNPNVWCFANLLFSK